MIEQKVGQRGTDEAFFKLMTLSGDALLKLLGMDAQTAETYQFHATVLKEKRLSPDIEGWSLMSGNQPRVLLEFHGYEDPYIRYRLASKVFMSCAQNSYHGQVLAGIIYTGEPYRKAALSLTPLEMRAGCRFDDCFVEVVLSDFSEEQLKAIDPRLLVLAPLTMQANSDPELLKRKGRRWYDEIKDIFPENARSKALEIMGLFAVAQFRSFTVQEIMQMFNFDPNPDWLFTKAYNEGREDGRKDAEAGLLLELLGCKFGQLADSVTAQVTGAERELIERWSKKLLFANSLDDVFAS
ncbi:MAG: Rpn family recombination-promoting nuclease/putative transposase [Magnetococcus sp. YQC-5]